MIVKMETEKQHSTGWWWGTISSEGRVFTHKGGFRTRKEAKAAMVARMIEIRDALDAAIAKEEK
jgi:hypothetical protein